MFSQFFGNYLLENELITIRELSEVLEIQDNTRLKLGVLAVNLGFMSADEIDKVHQKQAVKDKLFGELAVEMGFLTEEELDKVLSTQKKEHLLMAQTLIDKEIMTLKELEQTFESYKKDKQLSDEEFRALKENNVEKTVDAFLDFESAEESIFYKNYVVLLINNIVRFIDSKIRIKEFKKVKEYKAKWGAYQQIVGNKELFTAVFAKTEEFLALAEAYSEMEFAEVDELVRDSVAEFMNLQNGIFLVNSSNEGIRLEMKPQDSLENKTIECPQEAYLLSLELGLGDVDFIIAKDILKL